MLRGSDPRWFSLFVVFAVVLAQFPSLSLGSREQVHGHGDNRNANMTSVRCRERERKALQNDDSRAVFSSWGRQIHKRQCCKWKGVQCSNTTGHVIQLDLGGDRYKLQGKMITPKLTELQHLAYLDLSMIDFNGTEIRAFIASLTNLRHLDLSACFFGGGIPSKFANLTHLQYLDLSINDFTNAHDLNWLPPLSSLTYLDLSLTNLTSTFDWPEAVNNLPKLTNLALYSCGLPSPPMFSTALPNINSSKSLAEVDLSSNFLTSSIFPWLSNYNTSLLNYPELFNNHISGSIPDVFGNMSSLVYLDLSNNQIQGANPNSFSRLCSFESLFLSDNSLSGQFSEFVHQLQPMSSCAQNSLLEYLDLSHNELAGSIPDLTNFKSLKYLSLFNNQLRGRIPESIGKMSKLETLDLNSNALEGVIRETHFSQLSRLTYLDLSYNSLVLNLSSDWLPPFQLEDIILGSCKQLRPHFPNWLQTQRHYIWIDISDTGISDFLPSWFLDQLSPNLVFMNISHNQIRGTVQFEFTRVDLSWNELEGPLTPFLSKATYLDLSNNRISGAISSLCASPGQSGLSYLSLASNNISGELPDCLTQFENLIMLDLSNNSLSGKISSTIGSLLRIETLNLRGNKFAGELPPSLKNCTRLQVIDVGYNELSGPLPKWLPVSLKNLAILILSSNHFNGSLPSELCHLSHLQILELSLNNISGSISKCLNNLTTLAQKESSDLTIRHHGLFGNYVSSYVDDATLVWKRGMQVHKNTLGLVKSIDLSSNELTGQIPIEITHLVGLISLNLSRNQLTGQIPPDIGKLDSLDSLDLSRNHVDGIIPASLARIDRLGLLDLSYNNLSGKIPRGTQLQGFDPSVYAGNVQLCGPPLVKPCDSEKTTVHNEEQDEGDELITQGFYWSMAVGFFVGFWGVCGSLMFNKTWRSIMSMAVGFGVGFGEFVVV